MRIRRKRPTTRAEARRRIIAVANMQRRMLGLRSDPYTARHLRQAVRVVRHRGLVKDETLVLAGFRPVTRPKVAP